MTLYRVDPAALDIVASSLAARVDSMANCGLSATMVLSTHGYAPEARLVAARLQGARAWAEAWSGSLRTRVDLLEADRAVPATSISFVATPAEALSGLRATDVMWQLFAGTPAPSFMAQRSDALGQQLLDALSDGDVDRIAALLDQIAEHLTDVPFLTGVLGTLDADITGLLPTILLDIGVSESDLHRFIEPLGAALGVVESAGHLPFTAAELMAGHEGFGVTPLMYLDYGDFTMDFLVAIAGPAISAYGEYEMPLRGPAYMLPDGTTVSPDPRLAFVRALLDLGTADQRSALIGIGGAGLMSDLLSPATEWEDGGEGVAELLESLCSATDGLAALAIARSMDAVTRRTAYPIVLSVMTAVAPHLPSLISEVRLTGSQIKLEQTELRPALDQWTDRGTGLVGHFLFIAAGHPESRTLLQTTLAALIVGTIAETFDPTDPHALAPYSDDLGAVVQLVVNAQLAADLDAAGQGDEQTDVVMEFLGMAFGLVGSGVALSMKAGGFIAWAMEEIAGGGTAAFIAANALGLRTDNTEQALRDGFSAQQGVADFAAFALAAELHAAGLLSLPASLLEQGELVVPRTDEDWDALVAAIAAAGIEPGEWFNHVFAIVGYGLPTVPQR